MNLVLVADAFYPLKTSGAKQLEDLSLALIDKGHQVTAIIPSPDIDEEIAVEEYKGIRLIRLKVNKFKDVSYIKRTINEFLLPFFMLRRLKHSPVCDEIWDGVIWYSPSIFFGPLVAHLKSKSDCKSYLILRDIFPEWAVDMGLIRKGLIYLFFKFIANYQYSQANTIGIQSEENRKFINKRYIKNNPKIEVLHNWLYPKQSDGNGSNIKLNLEGKKLLIYAGNMGVAQNLDIFIELALRLRKSKDVTFLFIGRGSEKKRLESLVKKEELENVAFRDEVDFEVLSSLYLSSFAGLLSLDSRHKTHNVPGKFISYMSSGLPVIASLNPGNKLFELINNENVGIAINNNSLDDLTKEVKEFINDAENNKYIADRCYALFKKLYSPENASEQILSGLNNTH